MDPISDELLEAARHLATSSHGQAILSALGDHYLGLTLAERGTLFRLARELVLAGDHGAPHAIELIREV